MMVAENNETKQGPSQVNGQLTVCHTLPTYTFIRSELTGIECPRPSLSGKPTRRLLTQLTQSILISAPTPHTTVTKEW